MQKPESLGVDQTLTFEPLVAFEHLADGSFFPMTIGGRVPYWGQVRASAAGCAVYGVCHSEKCVIASTIGVFQTVQAFQVEATRVAVEKVNEVRQQKGYELLTT